jgi:hypothetical protein
MLGGAAKRLERVDGFTVQFASNWCGIIRGAVGDDTTLAGSPSASAASTGLRGIGLRGASRDQSFGDGAASPAAPNASASMVGAATGKRGEKVAAVGPGEAARGHREPAAAASCGLPNCPPLHCMTPPGQQRKTML